MMTARFGKTCANKLRKALKELNPDELAEVLREMSQEDLRAALKNMTKEEIRALKKAGKLKGIEGIEDLIQSESDESKSSDDDSEGGGKKKKKKKRSDSAYSYYSVTSEGGTRYVRRRHKREDGTYSDSESCPSDVEKSLREGGKGGRKGGKKSDRKTSKAKKGGGGGGDSDDEKGKKGRKKGSKGGLDGGDAKAGGRGKRGGGGDDADDEDSDYSVRSEVSEGGTRRKVKMKRIRDAEGNIVGYGEPMPADVRAASVAGRRGSLSGMSDQELDEESRRQRAHLKELEDQVTEEERAREAKRQKYMEEKERAAEQKRQQREREKEKERGKRGSNVSGISQDGVLLVKGKGGMPGEDGDEEGGGRGGAGKAGAGDDGVPSDFSDESLSDDENVDLSKMTEEEKAAYFAERERKKQLIEERRRAKYGDKYDEVMKKKQAKKEADAARKAEEKAKEEERRQQEEAFNKAEEERKRRMSLLKAKDNLKTKEKPKSMVTYDKGPPRWPQDKEKSELNKENLQLAHERRNSRTMTSESQRRASKGGEDLEGGKFLKLPPIKGKRGSFSSDDGEGKGRRGRKMHPRGETIDRNVAKTIAEKAKQEAIADEDKSPEDDNIEIGEDGKLRLKKGKKIDLSKLSDDMLKKLGIDPNMTAKEKAKLLKKLFGSDIMITEGSYIIGTKGIDEYDLDEVTDDMLAADMNLDLETIHGQRRMNILFRRGGMLLREHMKKVIDQSKLAEEPMGFRNDLDERGGIDFMQHYRLVDPAKIEAYAKAFVVEDGDLDTVINLKEALTALDGVPGIQHMTSKQFDYVFRVLNIDDASQVTFRMFAVITALCERVTCMDDLSKHLLEICNLADIERKLQLYRDMFYHNVQAGLDPNFITADSLKIELIAGGLSWLQQQYVMEKMEMDIASQISFLDYMCYIPLFMSMHDNIVDNPLDMSDQKYSVPPRTRPVSAQRDMNPLGFPLSKDSSLQMRQQAKDLMEGKLKPSDVTPEKAEKLYKYAKLPEIKSHGRGSAGSSRSSTSSVEKIDLIF